MKLKLSRMLLLSSVIAFLVITATSCKTKEKDADIKAAVENALRADPMSAGTIVDVKDGVATITGECKDDMCKASCEKIVAGVKGVKSVVNNCMIAPPAAPVEITADDALSKSVGDAIKDYPGVMANVKDGVITLTGEIAKNRLQNLMMSLQALNPKKIDSAGLIKK
ncbi:MAG: BON domain-containing protein [Chitinophagaceae bacterium]